MSDTMLGGRYKVLEAFDRGMKCRDEQTNTFVWLKPLPEEISNDPALLADAKRRCETLKNVQHEGIAQMLDVLSAEDGKTYMVIEYVEGITLRRWMQEHREDGIVPAKYAIPVLKLLANAIDAAHAVNEIHRHLMPECIMIDENEKPKILNLGIPYVGSDNAWMLEPWKSTGWEAFYRAPEQWRGQICTTWTDLYALGCIAYEMLSGHVPFDIPDINLLHGAVLLEAPPTIVSLPVAAQGTIARSLAKRGSERFNSCEDYIRSLSFETSQTKTVPRPSTGNVPKVNQPYAVPDIPNGVWTATTAAAAVAAASNTQNTGTIRGVTRGIPIALPNMPNTGTVRTVTGPLKTGPITGNYGKTGPITGKYTRTHTHILSNANEEIYGVWSDDSNGVKGVLFRVVIPLILISVIAGVMYYLIVQQAETLDETVIPRSEDDIYQQLTPFDLSNFGSEEEDKTEDSEDEEKEDSENNSQKSSDDSSENQTDDSSKTDNQLQKEDEKNDDSNNEVKPEDDSDHTDKPSSDDEPSSLKNNDDSTDVNTIAEDQDENPQPLTPLEAAGAEAVTDNIPKRSSPVR
ncbi:MAG: protein kinase, partial [Victivallales bacterium]|nr:protein kinase [Victivallales bacterium]